MLICTVCAGELQIPQETLYKKNVLLMRGRFRPFTLLHNDMLQGEERNAPIIPGRLPFCPVSHCLIGPCYAHEYVACDLPTVRTFEKMPYAPQPTTN